MYGLTFATPLTLNLLIESKSSKHNLHHKKYTVTVTRKRTPATFGIEVTGKEQCLSLQTRSQVTVKLISVCYYPAGH